LNQHNGDDAPQNCNLRLNVDAHIISAGIESVLHQHISNDCFWTMYVFCAVGLHTQVFLQLTA